MAVLCNESAVVAKLYQGAEVHTPMLPVRVLFVGGGAVFSDQRQQLGAKIRTAVIGHCMSPGVR